MTCSVIFSAFRCRSFEEATLGEDGIESVEVYFQRADLSTKCSAGDEWTDEYRYNIVYAVLMIAVFPVGVPLVLFSLLRLKRFAIEHRWTRRGGPELENLSFLFRLYAADRKFGTQKYSARKLSGPTAHRQRCNPIALRPTAPSPLDCFPPSSHHPTTPLPQTGTGQRTTSSDAFY